MRNPFVKFISHSASYMFFLTLLALASQRFEYNLIKMVHFIFPDIEVTELSSEIGDDQLLTKHPDGGEPQGVMGRVMGRQE